MADARKDPIQWQLEFGNWQAQARTYNAPMLDIKLIREKPDFVRQRLAARGAGDEVHVDELLRLDEQRRKLLAEVETLKAQRNRVSKEIGAFMAHKKLDEAEARKKEAGQLGANIASLTSKRPRPKRHATN